MSRHNRVRTVIQELRFRLVQFARQAYRRRVPRALAAYAVAGIAAVETTDILEGVLGLPEWTTRLVFVLVLAGLPVVIALSWALDLTADGVVRTPDEPDLSPRLVLRESPARFYGTAFLAVGLVGLSVVGLMRFGGGRQFQPGGLVAVIPSAVVEGEDQKAIHDAVEALLATRLTRVGWSTVDGRVMREALRLPLEPGQIARRVEAGHFLSLGLAFEDSRVTLRADLFETEDPLSATRSVEVQGDSREMAVLIDRLAAELTGFDFGILEPFPTAEQSLPRVAVLPASISGDRDYGFLSEGATFLLSAQLERLGWPTSDFRSLGGVLEQYVGSPESTAASAVRRVFASFYVVTSVEIGEKPGRWPWGGGPEIRVTAELFHEDTPSTALHSVSERGSVEELSDLLESAARSLGASMNIQGRAEVRGTPTTESLDALRAYVQGERRFVAGAYSEAVEAFQNAVTLDPTFSTAFLRLSIAAGWTGDISAYAPWERRGVDLAILHDEGTLTWRTRLLAEARRIQLDGNLAAAERLYRWLHEAFPDDYEFTFQLAEMLFHSGPLSGRSALESDPYWERVRSFEPDDFGALLHSARLSALDGRLERLELETTRALELDPDRERALEFNALRAFAADDSVLMRAQLDSLRELEEPRTIWTIASRVAMYARNLRGGEAVARLLTEPPRADTVRALGHITLAHLMVAQGRWRSAKAELERARALDPMNALLYRAALSSAPFLPTPGREEMEDLRAELLVAEPEPVTPAPVTELTVNDSVADVLRLYLLGTISLGVGSDRDATRYLADLEVQRDRPGANTIGEHLARSLRAQIHRARGSLSTAALELDDFEVETPTTKTMLSPFMALTRERFMLASILSDVGRTDEALQWFSSFGEVSVFDLAYLAPAHLARAAILDSEQDSERALAEYRRAVALWADPDPELVPLVERIEARVNPPRARAGPPA